MRNSVNYGFFVGPVCCFVALCAPSIAVAKDSTYEFIDGGNKYLDSSSVPDHYTLGNRSRLVADGARIKGLISENSDVILRSGTRVDGALRLEYGTSFDVSQTSIRKDNASIAMYVGERSKGTMSDSAVFGVGMGLSVNKDGELTIVNSSIEVREPSDLYTGWGMGVFGSKVDLSGSSITGLSNGVHLSLPGGDDEKHTTSYFVMSESSVLSINESAMKVQGRFGIGAIAHISVLNNSTIVGGNGILLEVINASVGNLNVDNSTLTGNLVADDTSTLNVKLQNRAKITGNIVNSETLAINSGASWTMVGDGQVKSLTMEGGRVDFGQGAFKTLTLNGLSGSGTFDMRINLDNHEGDLLKVAGQAQGSHSLKVRNTGIEVVKPDTQPLLLVDTDGGDAQFSLVGTRADLGVYSYELEQQGDDWFIIGSGKTISPSTQSVLALFNAAPNIWNSELSTLRGRMNEIRGREQGGGWMRAYGSRFNASTADGVDYRNNQSGLSFGADGALPVSLGELSLGLMAGYSKNDLAIGQGTSGKVGSFYVGGYGSWTLDEGYYVDAVLKLNRFRNESRVAMSDGTKSKGDYQSTGLGGSLEFGRHISFADGYFIEPYAQVSSVWVQGDSYALDNGMRASNDRTTSVLGKIGTTAGRSVVLKDGGTLRPYLRMAAVQEFSRKSEVEVNDTRFDNQLSGSRAELGAGVSVSLTERLQVQADFEYMKGKNVEQPWGANVGLKLAF